MSPAYPAYRDFLKIVVYPIGMVKKMCVKIVSSIDFQDVLYVIGTAFVIAGINKISSPAAYIVAGFFIMAPAVLSIARTKDAD